MHYSCLIVDDEVELAEATAEYFRMFEVSVHYVTCAEACFAFFEDNTADLILLDINLGDGSGFEVCKRLREDMQLPILFISARQSDDDVLIALSIGGDDYIKKPYSLSVLLAKVKVTLKRIEQMKQGADTGASPAVETNGADAETSGAEGSGNIAKTIVGASGYANAGYGAEADAGVSGPPASDTSEILCMEPATMSAVLRGRHIALKAKEYALLNCLYNHHDTIVTKEVLFDEVWGDSFFSDSTLNVHIRKLREKLEADPNSPELIRTVWGTGYILNLKDAD